MRSIHRIPPERVDALLQRQLRIGLVIVVIALGGGLLLAYHNHTEHRSMMWITAPIVLVVFIVIGVRIFRQSKRQLVGRWSSYELWVDSDAITRRQEGFEPLRVRFDEITRVTEYRSHGMQIYSAASPSGLHVSGEIDGYDQVRELLASRHPIERLDNRVSPALKAVMVMVLTLAAFATLVYVSNPVVIVPVGLAVAAYSIWALLRFRSDPALDERQRRSISTYALIAGLALLRVVMVLVK
jgi:uncharacterized membrane protein